MTTPLLQVQDVTKTFGGITALRGVSLSVGRGEIVALLGHNGSGKSTLVKIFDGVLASDSGRIELDGVSVHVIHQNLGLIDSLSAVENVDVGRSTRWSALAPIRRRQERAHLAELLSRFGSHLDPDVPVSRLTAAQRTIVAIVRALDGWGVGEHVLILDEPTATLHDDETAVLLESVRSVAARGVGVIYISHRLQEVVDLADRVVVLRSGQVVAEHDRGCYTKADLLAVIADNTHARSQSRSAVAGAEEVLRVEDISGAAVREATFGVRSGEIVGIAGLLGSGMEQLNSLLFGATRTASGSVHVKGRRVRPGAPRASIGAGLGYLPPDRLTRGGVAGHTARENVTLPSLRPVTSRTTGAIRTMRETSDVERWMRTVGALPMRAAHLLSAFSGGNQQKVLLAKWLRLAPDVLLLDEPTQGVDVGAQAEIHRLLRQTADHGAAIVVASSDTHELVEICDRILIMRDGRIVGELAGDRLSESSLIHSVLDSAPPTGVFSS